jgi:hypothetical protein
VFKEKKEIASEITTTPQENEATILSYAVRQNSNDDSAVLKATNPTGSSGAPLWKPRRLLRVLVSGEATQRR